MANNSKIEVSQETALTQTGNAGLEQQSNFNLPVDNNVMFVPNSLEQLAVMEEVASVLSQAESLGVETTQSLDLAKSNTVFNIIDAFVTDSQPDEKGEIKDLVIFKLEDIETREIYTVVKAGNPINLKYAKAFTMMKAINKPYVMEGFMFKEEPKFKKFNNVAVILVKAPKQVKSVNSTKR